MRIYNYQIYQHLMLLGSLKLPNFERIIAIYINNGNEDSLLNKIIEALNKKIESIAV